MNLTDEQAQAIVRQLQQTGLITPETIESIASKVITKALQDATELTHLVFCDSQEDGSCSCGYTVETGHEDSWNCTDHLRWVDITKNIIQRCGVSEGEYMLIMREFITLLLDIDALNDAKNIRLLFKIYFTQNLSNPQ